MIITAEFWTEKVIFWLDEHQYSVDHWGVVAQECYEKAGADKEKTHALMKEALISFHGKFKDAVVKPGNILYDILSVSLDLVDWDRVARSRLEGLNLDE
jgi:hypothetical protein